MKKIKTFLYALASLSVYFQTFAQNYPDYLTVINVPEAWNITQGDEDVIIAVLGYGIDIYHPDLRENIFNNLGEDADADGHTIEFVVNEWRYDPGDLNGVDDDGNVKKMVLL